MGNRAIIKADGSKVAMYLHWNGGRDSVEPFLTYCKLKGHRSPETDGYGWARLAQVIGNFFGGSLSIGMVDANDNSGEYCDNGAYIIKNWEIVRREHFDGPEQMHYDFNEMLLSIDEAQPETEQIGAYLKADEVKTTDLKIGDTVIFIKNLEGKVETGKIIGFGTDRYVNGHNVKGLPYMDRYGNTEPENNCNNYIFTENARKVCGDKASKDGKDETEKDVEIFINEQLNGIELKFKSKPDETTRNALKDKGFRWHCKKCVWYAKRNPERIELAQTIAKEIIK